MKLTHIYATGLSAVGVFVLGLALNAYATAGRVFGTFSSNSKIVIFVNQAGNIDVVREKLANMDTVASFEFVGKDKIFADATSLSPTIKEVLDAGENPFTPYFIVKPHLTTLATYEAVSQELKGIKGAEDVRYDAELVAMTQNLARFLRIYRLSVKALLFGCLGMLAMVMVVQYLAGNLHVGVYARYCVYGLASGIIGTALYYGAAHSGITAVVGSLTVKHMLIMVPAGMVCSVLLAGLQSA